LSSYWIDTDILVSAKNGPFPLNTKVAEVFWSVLAGAFDNGTIKMPRRVYKEIVEARDERDELAEWLSNRQNLCSETPRDVQDFAKHDIGGYLYSKGQHRYEMRHILRFSRGADPWLIAHAKIDGGAVVTNEVSQEDSTKPKIPDICSHFKVKCIHLHRLILCLEQRIGPEHCTDPFRH
jgi:uncharacterized protein DUF4411